MCSTPMTSTVNVEHQVEIRSPGGARHSRTHCTTCELAEERHLKRVGKIDEDEETPKVIVIIWM